MLRKLLGKQSGNLKTLAGYVGTSAAAGYFIGAYPEHLRTVGLPTVGLVGAVAKLAPLVLGYFKVGGKLGSLARKGTPALDVIGNALIGVQIASIATSHGFPKSEHARVVVPQGDVNKLKAAVPSATIVGVSQAAPVGRVLDLGAIEEIAKGRR